MAKTITSRPSIFGWTNHYDEHGKKIGESRPSIFGGVNHYDASGKKVGHSYPGIISDEVHYHANKCISIGAVVIAISFWRKTADVCCLKRRLILSNC